MRRTNWKTVSTLVTMIVIAGCQENVVSAPQKAATTPVSAMAAPDGAPQLSLSGHTGNNADVEFTVTPAGGVFFMGSNAVVFPANSICDPSSSSYGAGTWDDTCTPLSTPLTIHATVRSANGATWVDFSPSIRFVPSELSRQWVYMYMASANAILFAPTLGAQGVDDAAGDATVRTYFDGHNAGYTLRRIKHFTGYMTSSGRSCVEGEEDCAPTGN